MIQIGEYDVQGDLGFNGVSRQKSAALYHRGEGVAPISKIPPPPPSPSLSSPFFSPNPQRNLTLPAPLAVSSPTLLTLSLYSPPSVNGADLRQGNFPLFTRLKTQGAERPATQGAERPAIHDTRHPEAIQTTRTSNKQTNYTDSDTTTDVWAGDPALLQSIRFWAGTRPYTRCP